MKFSNTVLTFSQQNGIQDLMEAFADYYNHYKAEVKGKKTIYNDKISFAEKTKTLHESMQTEIARMSGVKDFGFSAAVNSMNPLHKHYTFAVVGAMVDAVISDSVLDSFNRFAEVRNIGFGDSAAFDVKTNDLFIVSKSGNGKRHAFAQRQFNGQTTLSAVNHTITVEEDLYRVLSGKRNLAEYATKIAMSVEDRMGTDIYNAINDTYSSLPSQFKLAAYTQTDFLTMAARIKAFNGGASVSAFGTQVALSSIVPSDNYFKMGLGEEHTRNGFLGNVGGVNLFAMDQKADWTSATYATKLDDTRVYLVSSSQDKLVKIVIEGDTLTFNDTASSNATLVEKQTMQKRFNCALISNSYFGILDLA